MPALTLERVIDLLQQYVQQTGHRLDLILIGRLALYGYGAAQPETNDLDAEFVGALDPLVRFLKQHQIPSNLGENISGWSVVAMPPGYRDRTTILLDSPALRIRLLDPLDFIIAKLRRGTEHDLDDATFVARRFQISAQSVQAAAEHAIGASPKDTALFVFRKLVNAFCGRLQG